LAVGQCHKRKGNPGPLLQSHLPHGSKLKIIQPKTQWTGVRELLATTTCKIAAYVVVFFVPRCPEIAFSLQGRTGPGLGGVCVKKVHLGFPANKSASKMLPPVATIRFQEGELHRLRAFPECFYENSSFHFNFPKSRGVARVL
jgi:hypothetical protein